MVEVEWAPTASSMFLVQIQVEALDRARLLSDVTRALSDQHVNILSASVTTSRDRIALSRFTFEMGDPKHLGSVLRLGPRRRGRLRRLPRHLGPPRLRAGSGQSGVSSLSAARALSSQDSRAAIASSAPATALASPRSSGLGPVRLQPADRLLELLDGGLRAGPGLGVRALPAALVRAPDGLLDLAEPTLDAVAVGARDVAGGLPALLDAGAGRPWRSPVSVTGSSASASVASASLAARFALRPASRSPNAAVRAA